MDSDTDMMELLTNQNYLEESKQQMQIIDTLVNSEENTETITEKSAYGICWRSEISFIFGWRSTTYSVFDRTGCFYAIECFSDAER